ncbi:hypothetical protein V6N13_053496 [Hibiscus sabdariffa]
MVRIPLLCINTCLLGLVVYGSAHHPCLAPRSLMACAPRGALPRRFAGQPATFEAPWQCLLARSLGPWRLPLPGVDTKGPCAVRGRFWRPGTRGVRLCMLPLPDPSVIGLLRPQGCETKRPCAISYRAACTFWRLGTRGVRLVSRAGWRVPWAGGAAFAGSRTLRCIAIANAASGLCAGRYVSQALAGDPWPIWGLPLPLLGAQVLALGLTYGLCITCLASFTLCLLLLLLQASAASAAASAVAASVPVSVPIGPAPAASKAVASAVPVTTGRVATGSAPMPAPPPCGKETADVDGGLLGSAIAGPLALCW